MVVSAVINEFNNLPTTNPPLNRLNHSNVFEYSTDISIESIELGDLSHLAKAIHHPVDFENCINKIKSNLRTGKVEKSRRGSRASHIIAKETIKTTGKMW